MHTTNDPNEHDNTIASEPQDEIDTDAHDSGDHETARVSDRSGARVNPYGTSKLR